MGPTKKSEINMRRGTIIWNWRVHYALRVKEVALRVKGVDFKKTKVSACHNELFSGYFNSVSIFEYNYIGWLYDQFPSVLNAP